MIVGAINPALVAALAGVAGALVAAVGFLVSQGQRRRENLDGRVQLAVNAALGETLFDFLKLGDEASQRVKLMVDEADSTAASAVERINENIRDVQANVAIVDELRQLLDMARRLMPGLERSTQVRPGAVLRQLEAQPPDQDGSHLVLELLAHESASSRQIERAGDYANRTLEDLELALQCYQRALELEPSNISARAEFLGVKIRVGPSERADEWLEELRQLALAYPFERNPLVQMLNLFIDRDQYQLMKDTIEELVVSMPENALLWRNLAVARVELGEPRDRVRADYDRAIELSQRATSKSEGDFVNTVRSYCLWLINIDQIEEARELLSKALLYKPSETSLYLLMFRLESRAGNRDRARRAVEVMRALRGDMEFAFIADDYARGLDALDYVEGVTDEPPVRDGPEVPAEFIQALMQRAERGEDGS